MASNREPKIDNPFTGLMYETVSKMAWQEIISNPPKADKSESIEEQVSAILTDPDNMLKEHIRTLLLTWSDTRARPLKTAAHMLARSIVKIYLDQVDWKKVYESYKNS